MLTRVSTSWFHAAEDRLASGKGKACRLISSACVSGHTAGAGTSAVACTEIMELQEMMYDRESGCLVSEQTLFAAAAGGARQLRAWHTQLVYSPAGSGSSTVRAHPAPMRSLSCACSLEQPASAAHAHHVTFLKPWDNCGLAVQS